MEVYSIKTVGDECYLYCGKTFIFAGTRQQVSDYLDWLDNNRTAD